MNALIVISLCIALAAFGYILFMAIKSKNFITKKNALYFVPLLIIMTFVYSLGYYKQKGSYDLISVFECFMASLKSFAFEVKRDYVSALMESSFLYKVSFYIVLVSCGVTTVSTAIGLVKIGLFNFFKCKKRLSVSPDFIIGTNSEAIEFAKKDKNSIILVEKGSKFLTPELKEELFDNDIAFTKTAFDSDCFTKVIKSSTKNLHIYVFDQSSECLNKIINLIKTVNLKEEYTLEFHAYAKDENVLFINKVLSEACKSSCSGERIMASAFNIHNIIGRHFASEHNLAEFLPNEFFDKGTLKSDKNIDVIVLGSGKVNNSVLKYLILNNQFIVAENKKYSVKPVNYLLVDFDGKSFDNQLVNRFNGTENTLELGAVIKTKNVNIKGVARINEIIENESVDENTFKYVFVNLGNSLDNQAIANSIVEEKTNNNFIVFYYVDSAKEIINANQDVKMVPYGFKNDLLCNSVVGDEKSNYEAIAVNNVYASKKGKGESFATINIVEKLSNVFGNLNIEFKLNLIGLSLKENENALNKDEIEKIISLKENENYSDYFKINARNALLYQEHARWVTYYYLNGFSTLSKEEITIDGENIIHKNLNHKKHACLVNFYDLDDVHQYEAKLLSDNLKIDIKDCLKKCETYQYDSDALENALNNAKIFKKA